MHVGRRLERPIQEVGQEPALSPQVSVTILISPIPGRVNVHARENKDVVATGTAVALDGSLSRVRDADLRWLPSANIKGA